jgi:hypothetical protein
MINTNAIEIIYRKLDPWSMEDPSKTKDQIFLEILKEIKDKKTFVLERNNLVFYLVPETQQRTRLHLFSEVKCPLVGISSAKEMTHILFSNIKSLQKLYGITPHKKFIKIIDKFEWKMEGTITHSFHTETNGMKDQYVFGISRPEYERKILPTYTEKLLSNTRTTIETH